jgi:hypothetical protein
MVFNIFQWLIRFILIFNILIQLMKKALQETLHIISSLLQNDLIHLGVYLKNVKILLVCR